MGRGAFVPLRDVPDYVWIAASKFVDARKAGPSTRGHRHPGNRRRALDARGGAEEPEEDACPSVWRDYFAGFAQAGCGPDVGALPFRVWQLWDLMVAALEEGRRRFVALGGVMARYVGDASQPLHTSYLHHGRLPMLTKPKGKFPVAHDTDAYATFKKTREAKIAGIYEERMLEIDALAALQAVDAARFDEEDRGRHQERLGRGKGHVRPHEQHARTPLA